SNRSERMLDREIQKQTNLLNPVIPLLPAHAHLDRLVHQPRRHHDAVQLAEFPDRGACCLCRWLRHCVSVYICIYIWDMRLVSEKGGGSAVCLDGGGPRMEGWSIC